MTIQLTAAGLRKIAPGAKPQIISGIVLHQHLLQKYGIDNRQRVSMFLGQVCVETAGLTRLEENLYYTTASRLCAVWPTRFRTKAAARPYLRNPQKLANKVYGGRLGNKGPNDGWLFRGSGCKQTTGKHNFSVVQRETGLNVIDNPGLLRDFPEALESACIYWKTNNLNRFADVGDVTGLTRAVQGGKGGLADRRVYTERALRVDWNPAAAGSEQSEVNAEPIVRIDNRGRAVEMAQERLSAHGYEIQVDGRFGPGTDNIVREFQEDHGLMPDGVIGPRTWKALKKDPEPDARVCQDKPINPGAATRSRTVGGAGVAGAGGAAVLVEPVQDAIKVVEGQKDALSSGDIFMMAIGAIIIAGALYALYARLDDGGYIDQWLGRD